MSVVEAKARMRERLEREEEKRKAAAWLKEERRSVAGLECTMQCSQLVSCRRERLEELERLEAERRQHARLEWQV